MYTPSTGRGLGSAPNPPTFGTKLSTGAAAGAMTGVLVGMQSGPLAGAIASGLAVIAPFTGPAAPFLMAAASLVGPIAAQFGCGKSCIQASQFADQVGDKAKQLAVMYWAQPVRYATSQAQALAYLDQLADWLRASCSDPSLGNAGQRCISERLLRGAPAPWCPNADHVGCDFYTSIVDPIANDAGVVPDPVAGSSSGASIGGSILSPAAAAAGSSSSLLMPLLLLGGLFVLSEVA